MDSDYINEIEPTPTLKSKKCKFISFLIYIFLQYTIFLVAIIFFFLYDYFIAVSAFLLSYVVMGIIRSKIRNSVIPPSQMEYQYNDKEIGDWYVDREVCF